MKRPIIERRAEFKNSETGEIKTILFYMPVGMSDTYVTYMAFLEFEYEVKSLENWELSNIVIVQTLTK